MKRYEQIADQISRQIDAGVLRPGERVPSVRKARRIYKVSPATVLQAYGVLESRQLIKAKSRSGYYVNPRLGQQLAEPETPASPRRIGAVDINDLVFEILASVKSDYVPFGSPFINPSYFPLQKLARFIGIGARKLKAENLLESLPPGNHELRRALARRYFDVGCAIRPDDIVITTGASEALFLSLKVTARPGELVAIEAPSFYLQLQAIQNLSMKAVQVPVHAREGMDLSALSAVLSKQPVKAVWLMTNFQNPVGCVMPDAKKKELVKLLAARGIPLIEDDVYEELYFGADKPRPAKAFDRSGLVLHCSSFSKTIGPGYRVGWAVPGKYATQLQREKWMTTLTTNVPAQAAMVEYLKHGGYEGHLRRLRRALESQRDVMLRAIASHFPPGTRASRPEGGYFTWVELPAKANALQVHHKAMDSGISTAPGPIFSAQRQFKNFLRLNYGHPWSPKLEKAVASLGKMVHSSV